MLLMVYLILSIINLSVSATEDVNDSINGLISDNILTNAIKKQDTFVPKKQVREVPKEIPMCEERACVLKCCPENEYIVRAKTCKKTSITYKSFDFSDVPLYDRHIYKTGASLKDVYTIRAGIFLNKGFKRQVRDYGFTLGYNHYLTEDGILFEEVPNKWDRWFELNNSQFCVDYQVSGLGIKYPQPRFWTKGTAPPKKVEQPPLQNTFIIAGSLISIIFLSLVVAVYAALPELRNLGGLVLMAYVASLLAAFLLQTALRMKSGDEYLPCLVLTLLSYFCWLASFCWTNIMSLDIWWTFRGYAAAHSINRRGELCKFAMYCAYAWGVPLAMTAALAALAYANLRPIPWFVGPDLVDSGNCFIAGEAKVLYLYVPMLILTMANWVFFLMTVHNMSRLHRSTAVLDTDAAGSPAAHRRQRYRLMVYLKLSVIMGIVWVLEVVSYFRPEDVVFYLSDAFNVLVGLFIFLIFVCKKQILAKLVKRYRGCRQKRRSHYKSRFSDTSVSDVSHEAPLQVCRDPKGKESKGPGCETPP